MLRIRARITYSPEVINALCRTQYTSFNASLKLLITAGCIALIFAAFGTELSSASKILCLFTGCIGFTRLGYIPKYHVKTTIAAIKGNCPETIYHFYDSNILLLSTGTITPPVGTCMFVLCKMTKTSIQQFTKVVFPWMMVLVVIVVLLVIFPGLITWLPTAVFS